MAELTAEDVDAGIQYLRRLRTMDPSSELTHIIDEVEREYLGTFLSAENERLKAELEDAHAEIDRLRNQYNCWGEGSNCMVHESPRSLEVLGVCRFTASGGYHG